MLVLGLMGSPRLKGNTQYLLSAFMEEARKFGARTQIVAVCQKKIEPCREYTVCEKKGFCPIDDDMVEIYGLMREAEVVVAATPVFFYNATAQLKALIDRSQTLWARRYRLKLTDPGSTTRRGFLLALGATKGKNLFEGLDLTAKYFFDAIHAQYAGRLTYRRIEHPGDMAKHAGVHADIQAAVADLLAPLAQRRRVLFLSRENACRSQMAAAFLQYLAGEKLEALCAGTEPADSIDPVMEKAMRSRGIDMAFRHPKPVAALAAERPPDLIIEMDEATDPAVFPMAARRQWQLVCGSSLSDEQMRSLCDTIEQRVEDLIGSF